FLDFEKPIAELEGKIEELRHLSSSESVNIAEEITRLQKKSDKLLQQTYSSLTPWQKVQVARHSDRPHFKDYMETLVEDFVPFAGDRLFAEDAAIVGGLGRFRGKSVMFIGHEKGDDTESRLKHNFGMPRPEGYRKAQRLMRLAEQYKIPVITLIDTAGAYPGIDAEERGQSEAIAKSIQTCLDIRVPLISVIIGEGGSGGAIAIAASNYVMMLEHSVYSVISPEGCAGILWRNRDKRELAAEAQKITAQDLLKLGIIEQIIAEPLGAAHRNVKSSVRAVGDALEDALEKLQSVPPDQLRSRRREKYLTMGDQ
ncbi:MAG: acetyl-CoA carboxylase carboxyltransferase subunit alpha, partial [Alphaproteobacteria bacterium]|nr:acetyl-CoA carboxylase carboxyltransferase subunit alpha [Alphaproteobacteria bacterium]